MSKITILQSGIQQPRWHGAGGCHREVQRDPRWILAWDWRYSGYIRDIYIYIHIYIVKVYYIYVAAVLAAWHGAGTKTGRSFTCCSRSSSHAKRIGARAALWLCTAKAPRQRGLAATSGFGNRTSAISIVLRVVRIQQALVQDILKMYDNDKALVDELCKQKAGLCIQSEVNPDIAIYYIYIYISLIIRLQIAQSRSYLYTLYGPK